MSLHTDKLKCLFLILLSGLLLSSCSVGQTREDAETNPGLTLFHLNDTYRIDAVEDGSKGGLGRVSTVVRAALDDGRDVRLLHAGDFLYPSLESQLWDGLQMIDAMNFLDDLAPMYTVVGNHETDPRSPAELIAAVRASRFDWLGDNYRFRTGAADVDRALHSEYIFDFSGKRIGIFALTMHAGDGGNDRDYVPVDTDYVAAAERAIRALEMKGVDLVFGLTHLHLWEDKDVALLKKRHPKFRFIAGGHEHEPEYSRATDESAAIIKGASNARTIWRIDIEPDANGQLDVVRSSAIELGETVASDSEYDSRVEQKWRSQMLEKFPFITARVGVAALPMDAREVTIRSKESSWANFIVDQMRTAFGEPAADLAFINSGTLRLDDYVTGDIHFEDIGRTFGFSSYLRQLDISGAAFRSVMEAGFRGSAPSQGYFPQVSGFRICVDRSREEGARIVSLQVPGSDGDWHEIEPDIDYSLVVTDYVYGGGDGYEIPPEPETTPPASELKYLVLDAIMREQAAGKKVGVPVDPANPRIVILASPALTCWP